MLTSTDITNLRKLLMRVEVKGSQEAAVLVTLDMKLAEMANEESDAEDVTPTGE